MLCHANRGQRSSRRDLNLAGIGCPLGAVGPRLNRCTRPMDGAVLQFPCLDREKPTLVWAVSTCLGLGRPFRRPWACAAWFWAVPPSCKSQMQARMLFTNQMPNRGEVAWELQLALCCRWRSTGERLLPWSDTHNVPVNGLVSLSLRQPHRGACLDEALL